MYHELLNKSEILIEELEAAFPGTTEGGVLQRDRLGEIVFRDEQKLKRLNEITHRHIMAMPSNSSAADLQRSATSQLLLLLRMRPGSAAL